MLLVALVTFILVSERMDHASGTVNLSGALAHPPGTIVHNGRPPYLPVYRVPLRVHLRRSGRSPHQFSQVFEEINRIWWSQAGICFEIQAVDHDTPLRNGMDIWFEPVLNQHTALNGYYTEDHDIWVRDMPVLGPAPNPSGDPAARTAAHEFGHGFALHHRQESDDNLMRSKTFGWQLNGREIRHARAVASHKALPDTAPLQCGPPVFDFFRPHKS